MCQLIKRGKRNHRAIPKTATPSQISHWVSSRKHAARLSLCMIVVMWGELSRGSGKLRRLRRLGPIAWNPQLSCLREEGEGGAANNPPTIPRVPSRPEFTSNPVPSPTQFQQLPIPTRRQTIARHRPRRAERENPKHSQRMENPTFPPSKTPPQHQSNQLTGPPSHPIAILVTRPEPGRDSPITHPTLRWAPRWPAGRTHWLDRGG